MLAGRVSMVPMLAEFSVGSHTGKLRTTQTQIPLVLTETLIAEFERTGCFEHLPCVIEDNSFWNFAKLWDRVYQNERICVVPSLLVKEPTFIFQREPTFILCIP